MWLCQYIKIYIYLNLCGGIVNYFVGDDIQYI